MFQISEAAEKKINEVLAQEKEVEDAYVRIYVSGVGWGGPKYGLTLDESVQEEKDVVEEKGTVKFVYDKTIASYLEGKNIDYYEGPRGGFSITDTAPGGSCDGCSC